MALDGIHNLIDTWGEILPQSWLFGEILPQSWLFGEILPHHYELF
jgi:hypothetical protein